MNRKITLGLTNLTSERLLAKARFIVTEMTDNPNFATPNPSLADITLLADELNAAIESAKTGLKVAKQRRDILMVQMKDMLRTLAAYVTMEGKGNGDVLSSSGFALRKEPDGGNYVDAPTSFLAIRDKHEGSVKLTWKSVSASRMYIVEVTTNDPSLENPQWQVALMTSRSKAEIDNLTRGTMYWYRVKAVGALNVSPWSDVSMVYAA